MLFLMIGGNRSFRFIRLSRASTQRLSSTLPCLIPMPYGPSRNRSSVSFAVRVRRRDQGERRVVEHDRVGATLVEREDGVRDAVHDDHLGAREAPLHPAVVHGAARRRDLPAADVGKRPDRRVVLDEQSAGRVVVRPREVDPRVPIGRVRERRDDHVDTTARQERLTHCGRGADERQPLGAPEGIAGELPCDLDVDPGVLAADVEVPERWGVALGADDEPLAVRDLGRQLREDRRLGLRAVAVVPSSPSAEPSPASRRRMRSRRPLP